MKKLLALAVLIASSNAFAMPQSTLTCETKDKSYSFTNVISSVSGDVWQGNPGSVSIKGTTVAPDIAQYWNDMKSRIYIKIYLPQETHSPNIDLRGLLINTRYAKTDKNGTKIFTGKIRDFDIESVPGEMKVTHKENITCKFFGDDS
jgi:hypothetical protein